MVMSGKGGVGKTTVAVNLALGLAMYGKEVGLMDADITGPNVPKMLNIEDQAPRVVNENEIYPVELPIGMDSGIKVISMAFLVGRDSPVVWRGPLKLQVLTQFVQNVMWGHLDYMLVDLPPGTSDEPLSIVQLLKPDGAIVVITPQDLALLDARKAIDMARTMKVPVLGIIENMSGFKCPKCGKSIDLFKVGGGQRVAEEMGVPFLGRIEIDPKICETGDRGKPFILNAQSSTAEAFDLIVQNIIKHYEG
jgi:Mrp family chromosome partitioning ATPase